MKAILTKCTIFVFKSSNMADNISYVEDPWNNGVEAFEISPSINTSKCFGFFGITMSILTSSIIWPSSGTYSSCACCIPSYLAKASFTSMRIRTFGSNVCWLVACSFVVPPFAPSKLLCLDVSASSIGTCWVAQQIKPH